MLPIALLGYENVWEEFPNGKLRNLNFHINNNFLLYKFMLCENVIHHVTV
jgi:hypothetical protein